MGIYFGDKCNGIEDIYPKHLNPDGYFQNKDVHISCFNLNLHEEFYPKHLDKIYLQNALNVLRTKQIGENFIYNGVKEPYLLRLVNDIYKDPIGCDMIVLLVLRNPCEVIESSNNFIKEIGNPKTINYKTWDKIGRAHV